MVNLALTSILLGLLTTTSPCILPLYPGFLAYLSGQNETGRKRYFLGLFVLAGVLTMMLVLGGIIAWLAVPVGRALAYLLPLADVLIFILGVLLLLDFNLFRKLPQVQVPVLRNPYRMAFVYGLLYGPIALPCCGPMVVSVFVLSFSVGEAINQLWTFLWFGFGLGIPLLVISLLSAAWQRNLTAFVARHSRVINIFGGLLLMSVAAYDVINNWKSLMLFF